MANRAGTAARAASLGKSVEAGVHLPGVYIAWQRAHAASVARSATHGPDPRFIEDPDKVDHAASQAARARRLAAVPAIAEAAAAAAIAKGETIVAVLLRPGRRIQPFYDDGCSFAIPRDPFFVDDVLYDITRDDIITVNTERTEQYRRVQAARRVSAITAHQPPHSGRNGHTIAQG